jgi:hypothetical protein
LNIEINGNGGAGAANGHDQLQRAGNLTLGGTLNVTETGSVPGGTYTIISLISGIISGSFSTTYLPPGYTLAITATTVTITKTILPVTLISFSGRKSANSSIILDWETASENNSDYFAVERSSQGYVFIELNRVQAAGNNSGLKKYEYRDPAPVQGNNYYRLKMTDNDGRFKYSAIIRIVRDKEINIIELYPNPASQYVTVTIPAEYYNGYLQLYNSEGQIIFRKYILRQEVISLDLNKYLPGMYYINVVNRNNSQTTRLIKRNP